MLPVRRHKERGGLHLRIRALIGDEDHHLATRRSLRGLIASTRQIRFVSYPQSCFRNAFTVATVGEAAVKYFGFAGGNGSGVPVGGKVLS